MNMWRQSYWSYVHRWLDDGGKCRFYYYWCNIPSNIISTSTATRTKYKCVTIRTWSAYNIFPYMNYFLVLTKTASGLRFCWPTPMPLNNWSKGTPCPEIAAGICNIGCSHRSGVGPSQPAEMSSLSVERQPIFILRSTFCGQKAGCKEYSGAECCFLFYRVSDKLWAERAHTTNLCVAKCSGVPCNNPAMLQRSVPAWGTEHCSDTLQEKGQIYIPDAR